MKPLPVLMVFCLLFAKNTRSQTVTLYFDYNRHQLRPASIAALDSLALFFKEKGSPMHIYISGHCDSIGGDDYNIALSEKRALEASDTLLDCLYRAKLKQPEIMLFPKGLSVPAATNATNNGRQLNRRVEINFAYTLGNTVTDHNEPVAGNKNPIPLKEAVKQSVAGDRITLRNLNFQGGLHRLLPSSAPVLNELLQTLKDNPAMEIDIQGHICCLPGPGDGYDPETATNDLSVQRAKTVYDFLVNNGIDKKRLYYRGFGHQFPLTAERTPDEEEQNRRVEIKIIRK